MRRGDTPATVRVAGGMERALDPTVLRTLDAQALIRFLGAQRWFGAKGRMPTGARVADVVPVQWADDVAAVTRLIVEFGDAAEASYQLPLVAREMATAADREPMVPLATIESEGRHGVLFDGLADARFRARLGAALARGVRFESGETGAQWSAEPVGAGPAEFDSLASRVISSEQSNTSVVYDDRAILKLFRKLEAGEHPEVAITHFLTTRSTFRHTPELLGTMHVRGSDGATYLAGMMSRYVPDATDGWTYALDRILPYLRAPADEEPANDFAADAHRIGAITRALHVALASDPSVPGFGVEPVTAADVDRWASDVREAIASALDLLANRLPTLDAAIRSMARAIAGRRVPALERLGEIVSHVKESGELDVQTRHHGDYHLGQTLRTPSGDWMIIDFEGEPGRPLAARSALASPRRDVASMLRSFAYAAATGAATAGGLGGNPMIEVRAAHWERDARTAFLAGYGARLDDPLIALFEMEKVFYELSYELNHRPAWTWIPLRGIAKLF